MIVETTEGRDEEIMRIIKTATKENVENSYLLRTAFDDMNVRLYHYKKNFCEPYSLCLANDNKIAAVTMSGLFNQFTYSYPNFSEWCAPLTDDVRAAKFDSPRLAALLDDFKISLEKPKDIGLLGKQLKERGDILLKAFYRCNEVYFKVCELIADKEVDKRIVCSIVFTETE